MFFLLSKILDLLFAPLTWAMALVAAGAWGAHKKRARLALGAPIAALVVLYVFSIEPVSNALVASLESSATKTMRDDVTYDAVVVLGGLADEDANETWGDRNYTDAVERILAGFEVMRSGRATNAVLSGGAAHAGQRAT
jgi:uncharacterized SAM-binding protein YcdF (DUF218 family)